METDSGGCSGTEHDGEKEQGGGGGGVDLKKGEGARDPGGVREKS